MTKLCASDMLRLQAFKECQKMLGLGFSSSSECAVRQCGGQASSFTYPDVSVWEPPSNQSDAVVLWNDNLALSGIGELVSRGPEYKSGTSIWQWFDLPFGQSVLAKRRSKIKNSVDDKQMPQEPILERVEKAEPSQRQQPDIFEYAEKRAPKEVRRKYEEVRPSSRIERFPGIDRATDIIIASNFDDATIGRLLKLAIDDTGGVEASVALSAIVAKARIARMRRR